MPPRRLRRSWFLLTRTFRRIARSSGSAHSIALGAAIGLFVAMTPTMGIQMLIAAGIATLLRANRITAIIPVWVTNPLTFIPIYVTCYKVGYWITGLGISIPEVQREIATLHAIQEADGGYAAFRAMLNLSMEVLLSLTLGSFLIGIVLAVPMYILTYKLVLSVRCKLHEKRARRAARILQYREGSFSADLLEKESYESAELAEHAGAAAGSPVPIHPISPPPHPGMPPALTPSSSMPPASPTPGTQPDTNAGGVSDIPPRTTPEPAPGIAPHPAPDTPPPPPR